MHTAKVISSIAILLVIITGFSIYTTKALDATSKKLDIHISDIEKSVSDNNWESAKKGLENIEQTWSSTQKSWAMLLDHFEIDNIDTTLQRLSSFIDAKDKPLALGEAAVLKQYVKHIPEKETVKFKNIL